MDYVHSIFWYTVRYHKESKTMQNVLKRVLSFLRDFMIKSTDPGPDTLMTPRVVKQRLNQRDDA